MTGNDLEICLFVNKTFKIFDKISNYISFIQLFVWEIKYFTEVMEEKFMNLNIVLKKMNQ